ncbi:hypothetical protein ACFXK0_08025 [Nocardia sp. NPDC059177]|uniref:DUF7373 family lipoprotein n=1 Tax=Nocardia sp. NPDC059177 TaxID=3346759 RepID=UPI0036C6A999
MKRGSRRRVAGSVVLLTAVLTGCGATVPGSAVPGEVDLSTLDTGSYPTEPLNAHDDPYIPPLYDMKTVAGVYLSDYTITAFDIDPRMKYQGSQGHLHGTLPSAFGNFTDVEEIIERHGMLYGFATSGVSAGMSDISQGKWPSADGWPTKNIPNELTADIAVMQFPDATRAAAAAQDFHDTDFASYQGHNETVMLPGHPGAHAQWQPGSPYLRAFLASGPYVIALLVSAPTPDLTTIVGLADTAYTRQLEALTRTQPLTDEQMHTMSWDPDHLLARTLNPRRTPVPDSYGNQTVTGRQGFLHYVDEKSYADREFAGIQLDRMKAERVAQSWGTIGIEVADPESAQLAVTEKRFLVPFAGDAPAPPNVPNSTCVENETPAAKYRFSCMVAYRTYVAVVGSNQILDAHQRAAAQFAIFANSR